VRLIIVEGDSKKEKKEFSNLLMERRVLDNLSNPQFQPKQLSELIRNPSNRTLVTPAVVDKVVDLMHEGDRYIRNFSANALVEIMKKTPELATEERKSSFFELVHDRDPTLRETFLKNLRKDVDAFKKLSSELRVEILERLCEPDPYVEVRKEARETVRHIFGISPEVSKPLSDEMLKFNQIQRREGFRLLENFSEELGKTKLDANAAFDEIRKLTKETGQHEFADFKMMVHIGKNLLSGTGDAEGYVDCLDAAYGLYREINKRIEETKSEMRKGDTAWNMLMEKLFKTWVPELAESVGYAHLAMGLRDATEKAKVENPDEFSIFEILKKGKTVA